MVPRLSSLCMSRESLIHATRSHHWFFGRTVPRGLQSSQAGNGRICRYTALAAAASARIFARDPAGGNKYWAIITLNA
jgi:hypothetical protein